jgi:hypothetical protein
MKPTHSSTVLLTLTCLAMWGILLKPFFEPSPALAQARRQYEWEGYRLDSSSATGGTTEITNDLRDRPKQGWKVSGWTAFGPSDMAGPYLYILWEK